MTANYTYVLENDYRSSTFLFDFKRLEGGFCKSDLANWENSNLKYMKTCSQCGLEKDFTEFTKQKEKYRSNCKSCSNLYYQQNKDKYRERYNKWRSENLERARFLERKGFQTPSRKHKHRINQAYRRALILKATIPGHEEEIKKIYDECPEGYHVDHIIPLKGKNVRGLHVPWNLQYLTATENRKKNNKVILK